MPKIHHVQLAMPAGAEEEARRFFGDLLGMREMEKPQELARRGGAWFRDGDLELHLGVEEPFTPARKAHPGILTGELDGLARRLEAAGHDVARDPHFPGFRRFYVDDCFGNRLEFLERIHSDQPTLRTGRLVLRPFTVADVDDVLAYVDGTLARFVPGVPWPYEREDAEEFVRRCLALDPAASPMFAIEHDDRVIGGCNLGIDREAATAELGYSIGPSWRGRGLASEAAGALLRYAFEEHDLAVVWARADAGNSASHRVLERVGMTLEGTRRGRVVHLGERRDERLYSVLREEWEYGAPR